MPAVPAPRRERAGFRAAAPPSVARQHSAYTLRMALAANACEYRLEADEAMSAGFLNDWSRKTWRGWLTPFAPIGVVLLLGGCGHSAPAGHSAAKRGSTAPDICPGGSLDVMARFLSVQTNAIATAISTGNDAAPQCSFTTRLRGGRRVVVIANVDVAPSPYFVLERTIVEASQVFGSTRVSPAPVSVTGLGLDAAWFPAEAHLMTTDGTRLITTSVDWPGASQKREIALARAVSRPYLKTPHGKAAQARAEGYPSG